MDVLRRITSATDSDVPQRQTAGMESEDMLIHGRLVSGARIGGDEIAEDVGVLRYGELYAYFVALIFPGLRIDFHFAVSQESVPVSLRNDTSSPTAKLKASDSGK